MRFVLSKQVISYHHISLSSNDQQIVSAKRNGLLGVINLKGISLLFEDDQIHVIYMANS
jgi:hypothetical protein